MIYIRMQAYNADSTLGRAIESVLGQTYKKWKLYVLDNGSKDKTREIISNYAELDDRIVPFYADKNYDYSENEKFWRLSHNLEEEDLYCVLDADDVYDETFLEKMITFLTENRLDIAICGSRFVNGSTGEICGERVLRQNRVINSSDDLDWHFPEVHWNLRQVWGKLYTAKAADARYDVNIPEWFPKAYGGDTVNVYECVKASERIGVYAEALHSYTISPGSVSYRWKDGRETDDFILFEKAKELLVKKCGKVSFSNLNFLYAVQFNALRDTLNVLFKSDLSTERKLELLKGIFENPITKQTFLEKGNVTQEDKTKLLTEVTCGIIELAQNASETSLQDVADIYAVFNPSFSELIPTGMIDWYIKKMPVIVRNVALGEYEYAVNNLLINFAKTKGADSEIDAPFVLGQILASLRNEEAKYVLFSKMLIRWCIRNNQMERARQDLVEWLQILPEDKELIELDQMCEKKKL